VIGYYLFYLPSLPSTPYFVIRIFYSLSMYLPGCPPNLKNGFRGDSFLAGCVLQNDSYFTNYHLMQCLTTVTGTCTYDYLCLVYESASCWTSDFQFILRSSRYCGDFVAGGPTLACSGSLLTPVLGHFVLEPSAFLNLFVLSI
jgi:hypothetical protein